MSKVADERQRRPDSPYALAGWGQRFVAWLIDGAINLLPAASLFWLMTLWSVTRGRFLLHFYVDSGMTQHVYGLNPVGLAAWTLIISLQWGLLMGRSGDDNGQTIGMRRAGIRVVADDGYELTGVRAIIRFLVQALFWLVFIVPGLLDALWPLVDRESRTWHDILCRTHVVRAPSPPRTWSP